MIVYTKTKPLVHVCIYSTFFVSIIIIVICNITMINWLLGMLVCLITHSTILLF